MKRDGLLLFLTRLGVYLITVSLPLIHPGIAVAYDLPRMALFFGIIPLEASLAFFLRPPRFSLRSQAAAALLPLTLAPFLATGFSGETFFLGIAGLSAYLLTAALFRFPRLGRHLALLEQVFLVYIAYRMLGFSRASEETAAAAGSLSQGILIFTAAAFLLHGMVIFYAAYRSPEFSPGRSPDNSAEEQDRRRKGREALLFGLISLAALILLTLVLPPDFVKNAVVSNLLSDEVRPAPVPLDAEGDGLPGGGLRSDRQNRFGGRRVFPWDGDGGGNRLEGIPQEDWPQTGQSQGQGQGGEDKQYAVMIAAGRRDPIYAAGEYRSHFHPLHGFLAVEETELNQLARVRLLETWLAQDMLPDLDRSEAELLFLSTTAERYLPYKPLAVEPTILHRSYGPFRYSYRGISRMSDSGPWDWIYSRDLDPMEEEALTEYLEVPLAQNDKEIFNAYLREALQGETDYYQKILAILHSFSTFQYNVGYDEDTSVPKLVEFLTHTREGDCTEFSNLSALLGRLAGIPSRVLTGYLAAGELQTPAHVRGLMVLRNAIKLLQNYPLEELFLVTTAHRHSWVQFYIPDFGWIDFETTSYAIPPQGLGDPNARDVVIPLLGEDGSLSPIAVFPWRKVLKGAGVLALLLILTAYLLRYGWELLLFLRARGSGDRAVRAVYRLLLLRLAAEGRPFKKPSRTSTEYADLFPDEPAFAAVAALYTPLRYRENLRSEEREALMEELRRAATETVKKLSRPGILGMLRRILSLRGLWYL